MKRVAVWLMIVGVLTGGARPALAAQRNVGPDAEAVAVRQMAQAIPMGTRVKVQTTAGKRVTATLMTVTDEGVVIKRIARVPEPAVAIRYEEIARLEPDDPRRGMGLAKAIGIGVGAGAGALLALVGILLTID